VFRPAAVTGAEIHPGCSSFDFDVLHILEFVLNRVPNKSPEPTAVGRFRFRFRGRRRRSAVAQFSSLGHKLC
jgi:hypothetical protein